MTEYWVERPGSQRQISIGTVLCEHARRLAAEHELGDAAASVRAHHDEIAACSFASSTIAFRRELILHVHGFARDAERAAVSLVG